MNTQNIMVIGSGIMGSGISQVIATSDNNVKIVDNNINSLSKSKQSIEKSLQRLCKKNILSVEKSNNILKNNLSWHNSIEDAIKHDNNVKIVIEAVPEDSEIKNNIIELVNRAFIDQDIIYASNTSSISITKMAQKYKAPEKFIGMHFMNPVPVMKLVEIIPGLQTNTDTVKSISSFAHSINKVTIQSQDRAGFIANRILMPMINEAFFALMENIGTPEDIDKALHLGCNQPMGPLMLGDFIGLDTCLSIMNVLQKELGDDKYRACPLLKQYVSAGWLGKKSGRGVYTHK